MGRKSAINVFCNFVLLLKMNFLEDQNEDEYGQEDFIQAPNEVIDKSSMPIYYVKRPANCASETDLPPNGRQESNFVGLRNQGATCYVNALFQVLFMNPQFRDLVFQLPLEHGPNEKVEDAKVEEGQ